MFTIEMLDAYEGDALWIEYGDSQRPRRLLVDCGRKRTYREIARRIEKLSDPLELLVITHVDDDHIFGAVPLLGDGRITAAHFKDVWYNGYTHLDRRTAARPAPDRLGPLNGEFFAGLLLKGGFPWNEAFGGASVVVEAEGPLPAVMLEGGLRLTLLSPGWGELARMKDFWKSELGDIPAGDPEGALRRLKDARGRAPDVLGGILNIQGVLDRDKEAVDTKEPNGSSIAFLAEYKDRRVLFAADAHPPVLQASLQRLMAERGEDAKFRLNAFKLSHHGSKNNISRALLKLIDCDCFLISTSGKIHGHPDKQALARIVERYRRAARPTRLYFNHRSEQTEPWGDSAAQKAWNYKAYFPPTGCRLEL